MVAAVRPRDEFDTSTGRVVHVVEDLKQGGIARVALTLAGEMVAQGVQTDIFFLDNKVQFEVDPGIRLRHVPIHGISSNSPTSKLLRKAGERLYGRRRYRHLSSPWYCHQLRRRIQGEAIACLFFHGLAVAWPFHRWSGQNSFFVLHSLDSLQVASKGDPSWNRAAYATALDGKAVIAVSEMVRQDAIRSFDVAPSSITTIHNPVDITGIGRLAEGPCDLPPEVEAHGYLIYVGRLGPPKRLDLLLRAYRLADIAEHLLIVGEGEERGDLERLSRELRISSKVHFLGFSDNPYPFMRQAEALVLASDYEGFGLVLIEALASRTKVISTRNGPAEEILTGPLAHGLVPCGTIEPLAEKMREVSAGGLCPAAPGVLSRYDKAVVAREYLKLAGLEGVA